MSLKMIPMVKEDHTTLRAVDPDVFPTDIEEARQIAQEYAKSMTAMKTKDFVREVQINGEVVEEKYRKICNYSGKYIREESLSIWCENIELYFLGAGYPMYFDFVKSSLIILFLIFVSSGSYNLFSNAFMGKDCKPIDYINKNYDKGKEDVCQLSWTTLLSLANKRNDINLVFLQDIMNLITIITIALVLQYLRTNQRVLNEDCDLILISPSDYTIWIQKIPPYDNETTNLDEKLEEEFNEQMRILYTNSNPKLIEQLQVVKITVCYKLTNIFNLTKEKNQIIEQMRELKTQGVDSLKGKTMKDLQMDLDSIKKTIYNKKKEYYKGTNPKNNVDFNGNAFITLNTEQGKTLLLAGDKSKVLKLNGQEVKVIPAPEPTDINWNNLHISGKQQLFYTVISDLTTFFLLVISFLILLTLMRVQSSYTQKEIYIDEKGKKQTRLPNTQFYVKVLAFVISMTIPALNYGLKKGLRRLSYFEKHHRKTRETSSMGFKLAVAQFINTALMSFIIKVMFDFFSDRQKAEDNIYTDGGLIFNQQYVFITNSLVSGINQFIDGGRIFKYFYRKCKNINNMTQREINTFYEETEHNLAFEYSGLMRTMLFTAFYAPLIPVGTLFSMVGIIFLYFVQKLSNITFEYILVKDSKISIFSILGISIGILNIFLPMGAINEYLFYVRPCPPNKETYEYNQRYFQFDYDRANPATDEYARKLYVDKEVYISKQELEI